jgi:arginine exporter protein ArgO
MTTNTGSLRTTAAERSPSRTGALAVGIVFLVVGIAGFVPGLTSNLDLIEFAGHESGAELLGVFQVSVLHNLVHLLFGVIGIAAAREARWSRSYLIAGGAVYLVLWLYGLIVDETADANFVPVNSADDWLHLGLGVAMIALGVALSRELTDRRHGAR